MYILLHFFGIQEVIPEKGYNKFYIACISKQHIHPPFYLIQVIAYMSKKNILSCFILFFVATQIWIKVTKHLEQAKPKHWHGLILPNGVEDSCQYTCSTWIPIDAIIISQIQNLTVPWLVTCIEVHNSMLNTRANVA
ncbi:hypothetical protein ACJX0J_032455 [Zea mays]